MLMSMEETMEYVHQLLAAYPLPALGGAFVLGILLGIRIKSGKKKSD